jgi:hypothetical protein
MKIHTIDKIFKFVYVFFLTVIVSFVLYMMTVLIISPKNDLKQRGFIACTRELVLKLGECESGQMGCVFTSFYKDIACNSGVIAKGFTDWLKGMQSTPWANYIFEPEWQEESENPYLGNPETDMENMAFDREFMRQKEQELEDIKNRSLKADETVIISDPETEIEPDGEEKSEPETVEKTEQDIDDEALIGEIGEGDLLKEKIEKLPPQKLKNDSDKIAQKAKNEVLKKENKK